MTLKQISMAFYATYITNKFGIKLKKAKNAEERIALRMQYATTILKKLNITIKVLNKEKIPEDGKFLLISNHRSIIDPLIVELALKDSKIDGFWVAKKELYNSFFFGNMTRNAGSILLDREASNMSSFFKDTKEIVKQGHSIFVFPEGTRYKGEGSMGTFKDGSKIIALKNRLPILPVFIKSNAHAVLKEAIEKRTKDLIIEIEIGDIIDYKDKTPLEENYKRIFDL